MDLTDWESRTACSTMEAYVTCPVCKEVVHNPHILPCLHSMCYECALTLEKQTHLNKCGTFIVCPICREMDVDRVGFQRDHNMEVILGIYCSLLNFDQSKMSIKIPKPVTGLKQTLLSLVTCQLCQQTLRDPVSLHCLHTYCTPCIEKHRACTSVVCPQCDREMYLGANRPDFRIKQIMDIMNGITQ